MPLPLAGFAHSVASSTVGRCVAPSEIAGASFFALDDSPEQQLALGKIDIDLHGAKVRGGFSLVRTGKSSPESKGRERWLLVKRRDEYADPSWDIESPR